MSVFSWSVVVKHGVICEVQVPQGYILHVQQAVCQLSTGQIECHLKAQTKGIDGRDVNLFLGVLHYHRDSYTSSCSISKNQIHETLKFFDLKFS